MKRRDFLKITTKLSSGFLLTSLSACVKRQDIWDALDNTSDSTFNPSNLSNLTLWLKADDGINKTLSNEVYRWNNQASNN